MPKPQVKILFISHSYPPIVGGVETHNHELFKSLTQHADVTLLANRNRKLLPIFFFLAAVRAALIARKYDVILLGSCILANVAWFIRLFTNKPIVAVAHGLDLTFKNPVYQTLWVKTFLRKINRLIAVGHETVNIAIEKGYPQHQIVFIPNGVNVPPVQNEPNTQPLESLIGQGIANKKILLTTGRLAKRKGVAWFISHVLPQLDNSFLYVVAGKGPDLPNIQNAIQSTGQQKRLILLGFVSDETRDALMRQADLFIQPNINIPNDIEGFGISVIEAGAMGLPVLASNLQGLKDAIHDNQNGFLVDPENPEAYIEKIQTLFADGSPRTHFGKQTQQYVLDHFNWAALSKQYIEEIEKVLGQ